MRLHACIKENKILWNLSSNHFKGLIFNKCGQHGDHFVPLSDVREYYIIIYTYLLTKRDFSIRFINILRCENLFNSSCTLAFTSQLFVPLAESFNYKKLWIVNYCVKSLSNDLSNENKTLGTKNCSPPLLFDLKWASNFENSITVTIFETKYVPR